MNSFFRQPLVTKSGAWFLSVFCVVAALGVGFLSQRKLSFASTNCANATIPQAQCQALVDIYNQMGGTNRSSYYVSGENATSYGGPSSGWAATMILVVGMVLFVTHKLPEMLLV